MMSGLDGTAYLLVHGAWHGPWCWGSVGDLLRDNGATVTTPTLSGLGSDSHQPLETIDLDRHVLDVLAAIRDPWLESGTRLVLVGHSYGGMVVTEVAAKLGNAVDDVAIVDGFLPLAGESALDLFPESVRQHYDRWIAETAGVSIAPRPLTKLGVTDPVAIERNQPRLTPQPAATFRQPARLGAAAITAHGTFLPCVGWPTTFDQLEDRARELGWDVAELAADHEVMITDPPLLAHTLAAI